MSLRGSAFQPDLVVSVIISLLQGDPPGGSPFAQGSHPWYKAFTHYCERRLLPDSSFGQPVWLMNNLPVANRSWQQEFPSSILISHRIQLQFQSPFLSSAGKIIHPENKIEKSEIGWVHLA